MEVHEEFQADGLVVLAMSNEEVGKVAPYAESYGLPFPVAAGSGTGSALGKLVGARGIPHSYLIDAEGKLVWHGHPSSLSNGKITSALRGATRPGKTGVLAWRGTIEGAPADALVAASAGELGKAFKVLGGDESPGAAALLEALDAHVALLMTQVDAGFERRDVVRSLAVLELMAKELRSHSTAAALKARLAEVRKDDGLQAELGGQEALERAMELGRKRGMKKARKSLERLIENYPGTKAAERARQLLRRR